MSRARRRGYRFGMTPEWVLFHPTLSDRAVRLFGVLDRHVGADDECWPSRARLAEIMGCSVDSIDRAKAELVAVEALTVEERRTDAGDRDTNLYVLQGDPPDLGTELVDGVGTTGGGGRTGAATGGREGAARGGRTGAAWKESQVNETPPTPRGGRRSFTVEEVAAWADELGTSSEGCSCCEGMGLAYEPGQQSRVMACPDPGCPSASLLEATGDTAVPC